MIQTTCKLSAFRDSSVHMNHHGNDIKRYTNLLTYENICITTNVIKTHFNAETQKMSHFHVIHFVSARQNLDIRDVVLFLQTVLGG